MAFKGMTWPVEGGLDNGVVCRQVVPFHCVTNLCHHVVRVELEDTATDCRGVRYAGEADCLGERRGIS